MFTKDGDTMKEKKDIFNGKIKKEYFSYIFGCMIFFMLLFVVGTALCIYTCILGMTSNILGERGVIAVFGVAGFVIGGGYVFPTLFVIRKFPKYPKLRRILFNSECYFTDSTSNEYLGDTRTISGRRNKLAFDLVTTVAELEKGMGDKKPIQYKIYCILSILTIVLGVVIVIAMPLLFENGTIFPNMSDGVFALCYIFVAIVCIALAIFFLVRALKVALMKPWENEKWHYPLYTGLLYIAVRKNNKKRKFWYDADQLNEIEDLVHSANENAELKLERKGDKLSSFKVSDTLNDREVFNGLFI